MTRLPDDYGERVYAGVLGKTIGVYLGRPFEGWTYEMIQSRLGDVENYVQDQVGVPLLVTDDDLAGTFTFPRVISDQGFDPEITSEQIGEGWLNTLIENRTVLWWGGLGNSTEHTAFLRLKSGINAPRSGSAALNSQVVAEQIGAQIFIDGWAMLSPGDPSQAARLAECAARVSHDGDAVHAAVVLAVMESMAFVESDTQALLETALGFIPTDSIIRQLIDDVREWSRTEADWRATRERVAARYGYDRYGGNCHVVPNHGLIVLSLLHGRDDFSETLKIVNTCGWDTDCNSGNVGCLMGIKNGLEGIDAGLETGRDWRGPVADRLYVSAADPSWGISDCVRESLEIVNASRCMRGQAAWSPKNGAQFHFEMPGSMQGFVVTQGEGAIHNVTGRSASGGQHTLRLAARGEACFGTPVFVPSTDAAEWFEKPRNPYPLVASPRIYPGQTLTARLLDGNGSDVALYVRYYDQDDQPQMVCSRPVAVDDVSELTFEVPPEAYPAFEVGLETRGSVHLDFLRWEGEPNLVCELPRGSGRGTTMRRRAWVNGVDDFSSAPWVRGFRLIQNDGRGLLIQGNRDWRDIAVSADVATDLATCVGVAVRVQGMRRYYALLLNREGDVRLVKRVGGEEVLASVPFEWRFGETYDLSLAVSGETLSASIDGRPLLTAHDAELSCGGMALVVEEGCSKTRRVSVAPA